ncbi:MAG: hypothetical protein AB7D51_07880 [Desulfovibrionaceae bacterium]
MKGIILCLTGIVALSMVVAVGWTGLTLPEPVEPLQLRCPERVAGVRGVFLDHMRGVREVFQRIRKHVSHVDISVDESAGGGARYEVALRTNSGSMVVARGAADWPGLDAALARELERCLGEFQAFRRDQGDAYRPVRLSI